MSYGSLGNVYGVQDPSQMPEWLRRQYQQMGGGGESGSSYWTLGSGMNGSFKDSQGRDVIQIGQSPGEINKNPENGKYLDPSKIWEDPELGYVTTPDNFKGAELPGLMHDPMFLTFLAITGAGLGAQGLGMLGGEAGGGLEGGAFDMGGSAGFGGSTPLASAPADSYWGMLADGGNVATDAGGESLFGGDMPFGTEMPNTYAPGADPTSAFGLGDSYYTPGLGSGMGGQQGFLERILGPLANPSELPQWAMDNPGSALRAAMGIGSMINGVRGATGGNSGGNNGGGMPWANGQVPTFNPQQMPFVQNPYLNYKVPFMGG